MAILDSIGAHPDETTTKIKKALWYVVATLIFLLILFLLAFPSIYWKWPWAVYAALVGVVLGCFVGLVLLVRLNEKARFAGLGSVLGVTLNQAINSLQSTDGTTIINSIAKIVINVGSSISAAATETRYPPQMYLPYQ